jgi:hypothetical protein
MKLRLAGLSGASEPNRGDPKHELTGIKGMQGIKQDKLE